MLQRYGLLKNEGFLITDGGMENKGALDEMLARPGMLWKRLTAQIHIIQSNCMIEAANRILKYRYLYLKHIFSGDELKTELQKAIIDFNSMPNGRLHGLTPNEVLSGLVPNKACFIEQISTGCKSQQIVNRLFNCRQNCRILE